MVTAGLDKVGVPKFVGGGGQPETPEPGGKVPLGAGGLPTQGLLRVPGAAPALLEGNWICCCPKAVGSAEGAPETAPATNSIAAVRQILGNSAVPTRIRTKLRTCSIAPSTNAGDGSSLIGLVSYNILGRLLRPFGDTGAREQGSTGTLAIPVRNLKVAKIPVGTVQKYFAQVTEFR